MRRTLSVLAFLCAGCSGASLSSPSPSHSHSPSPSGPSRESPSALLEKASRAAAGRPEEAEALYGRAVQADPTLVQVYWERGRMRLARGQHDTARQDLDRWLEGDPRYALVRADLDLLLFSDRREALQREEEAAGRGAEAEGSHLAAFRHYAAAYALSPAGADEDRLAEALIRTWKACSPKPAYPPALRTFLARAQFLAGEGSHEEAAAAYHQAARFCPWCAEAHFNEALILGEYQRYPEALRALRRALALLPEGPDAQEAEGMLLTWEMLGS